MLNPFDWEEDWDWVEPENLPEFEDIIDWEKMREVYPIPGQMSMFPPDKNYFLKAEEDNNNLNSSFEDIVYKNPAYTKGELSELHEDAKAMDHLG